MMEKPLLIINGEDKKKQAGLKQKIAKAESQQEKATDPWAGILFGPSKNRKQAD
jgi:hypothetical protein